MLKRDMHAMVRNSMPRITERDARDPTTPTAAFHRERYGDRLLRGFPPARL